jgi:hypothetical protein
MSGSLVDFCRDLGNYLFECCNKTGYGKFEVSSERAQGSIRLVVVGTPSRRYVAADEEYPAVFDGVRFVEVARSLHDVRDLIVRRVCEIWRDANGNGSALIECRRQANGRTRIEIWHSYRGEIVLRPEEIQLVE